jgi:hypothetical protein
MSPSLRFSRLVILLGRRGAFGNKPDENNALVTRSADGGLGVQFTSSCSGLSALIT